MKRELIVKAASNFLHLFNINSVGSTRSNNVCHVNMSSSKMNEKKLIKRYNMRKSIGERKKKMLIKLNHMII